MSDGAEHRTAVGGGALARPLQLAKERENRKGCASDAADAAIFRPLRLELLSSDEYSVSRFYAIVDKTGPTSRLSTFTHQKALGMEPSTWNYNDEIDSQFWT